jgi:hypothetical protein
VVGAVGVAGGAGSATLAATATATAGAGAEAAQKSRDTAGSTGAAPLQSGSARPQVALAATLAKRLKLVRTAPSE